ncbi:uncharacterized protein LOC135166746 [Diachasmimorpha longicaudata]|uniref:uncharacterized protein LOC135166746 n=1 Tax=Diachasmimorpha longicaudata TaxID=58733 RepID=UPI0030B8D888
MQKLQQQILNWCDDLEDYLKCTQCERTLNKDVYLCEGGHLICLTCSRDSANTKCSICKLKYTKIRNSLAENLAQKMATIREKLEGCVEDDDLRSVCSESNNIAWKTFTCWIGKCKTQGSIDEMRRHYETIHSGLYVKHCDGELPHKTSFFLEYSFPRTTHRLLDLPNIGLFVLLVVIYDNGALRAHFFMYETSSNAQKYQYKLKIECNSQNSSVEGVVQTVRLPKSLFTKNGLFIQRAHNLQKELQNTLKYTCHVEVHRNTEPPEPQKFTAAKYKSRNQKSTEDHTDSDANKITEDSSDIMKKPQKGSQKNRDKSANENSIPKKPNPQKKEKSENEIKHVEKKAPKLQDRPSRMTSTLQPNGADNSQTQSSLVRTPARTGATIPPIFAHPSPFNSVPNYTNQAVGNYTPSGTINYPGGGLPTQGLFPGANPHYRPPPAPGTPGIPGAGYGLPSAPLDDGNGHYVQYPDLTAMKNSMSNGSTSKLNKDPKSKKECVIS